MNRAVKDVKDIYSGMRKGFNSCLSFAGRRKYIEHCTGSAYFYNWPRSLLHSEISHNAHGSDGGGYLQGFPYLLTLHYLHAHDRVLVNVHVRGRAHVHDLPMDVYQHKDVNKRGT